MRSADRENELRAITRELRDLDHWRSISGLTRREEATYGALRHQEAVLNEAQRRVGGG